jgi:hypothetical protein
MAAKTRSAQASGGLAVGDGLGEVVGDGLGDGVGFAEGEPHVEVTAITNRRMATKGPRRLSDEFFMVWVST